jgi:hypothetical protein
MNRWLINNRSHPIRRIVALGPAVLVLLPLTGCGTAATKTTTVAPEASPLAAQRAVVGVLTSYEDAYSAHSASALRAILAGNVSRTGEGANGCGHVAGRAPVLAVDEAQWTAGAGRYQFVGLSPQAVKIAGQTASVKLSYRITPASKGTAEFHLADGGTQWLITSIVASCYAAPTTTPTTTASSQTLSPGDWGELNSKTDGALLIVLGGKAPAGEEGRVAFLHHEEEATSDASCAATYKAHAPCFRQVGEQLAHVTAEQRRQAAAMTEHVRGPCAEALQTDGGIWAGLERVAVSFEHEQGSGEGQDEWQRAAAPAEHLISFAHTTTGEEPRTELGAGLEACKPPGDQESG